MFYKPDTTLRLHSYELDSRMNFFIIVLNVNLSLNLKYATQIKSFDTDKVDDLFEFDRSNMTQSIHSSFCFSTGND